MIRGKLRSYDDNPEESKKLQDWVPIEYILEWFRDRTQKTGVSNRVLVLKSETASGKSTMFPPELYRAFTEKSTSGRGIICTQPRVMTAIENVHEILNHYSKWLRLGVSIGWSTKYNKIQPTNVGLLSATIGTLSQQLRTMTDAEIMDKYQFILIDETHERDLQTDVTIYMLKNLLNRCADNPRCPFVALMSATFNPDIFLKYFGLSKENFIWCSGAASTFSEMWDWNEGRTLTDYTRAAAEVVEKIITENPNEESPCDIMIFMPGLFEIKTTYKYLEKLNEKLAETVGAMSILRIDGDAVRLENDDFKKTMRISLGDQRVDIDGKTYTPIRRCIITTNVAETGLTISSLKYVIDSGYNREVEYFPAQGVRGLITKPAPKSRIIQRRGRAGRKFPGVFYPLYPHYIFERLQPNQLPQILTEDTSSIILDLISEQLKVKTIAGETNPTFNTTDIDMLDVPSADALACAVEKCFMLGFLAPLKTSLDVNASAPTNSSGLVFTPLGILAHSLSLPLEISRMILGAFFWEASILDVITIGAFLITGPEMFGQSVKVDKSVPGLFYKIDWDGIYHEGLPGFLSTERGLYHKYRLLVSDEFIGGVAMFAAIQLAISGTEPHLAMTRLDNWCSKRNVRKQVCLRFMQTREDIIEHMISLGIPVFSNESNSIANSESITFIDAVTRLKYCIHDGFRANLLVKKGSKYYARNGMVVNPPNIYHDLNIPQGMNNEYAFVSVMPEYVIYRELTLERDINSDIYGVVANTLSCMDGYVATDNW